MKRILAVGTLVVITLTFAEVPAFADTHPLVGTFTLQDGAFGTPGASCSGTGGYDDIQEGAQVRVRNGNDHVIAVGQLGAGKNVDAIAKSTFEYCRFPFKVKVPDSAFYSIEISHRGSITYPKKKLERAHWRVALTLG